MFKTLLIFLTALSTTALASQEKYSEEDNCVHQRKKIKTSQKEDDFPNLPVQESIVVPVSERSLSISHINEIIEKRIWGITDDQVKDLFDGTSGLFCIFSNNTMKLKKLSADFIQLLGHSEETLYNELVTSFWHPDEFKRTYETTEGVKKKSNIFGFLSRWRCADGSYRTLKWTSLAGHFSEASSDTFGMVDDITPQEDMIHSLYRELQKKNRILNALDSINSAYLLTPSINSISDDTERSLIEKNRQAHRVVMDNFIDMTHSCQGIFEEVFYDDSQRAFVNNQSISLIFNQDNVFKKYREHCDIDKNLIFYRTLIDKVLVTLKPSIVQSTPSWRRRSGDNTIDTALPQNQYTICIPLLSYQNDQKILISLVTLSSYTKGYSLKTIDKLKVLIDRTARIVYEKKMEQW